ncbi:MAG: hypothetical protein A2W99_02685 [Bacteroidetes bacterium GWF2_33_16]|nr:MAG: hypothetical protein A2X00_07910 [Bacteroidetes bacterium GWE2_32_14]OFY07373.1 MAG: hypothetical protein A2W99_02685 [Bacteroidetes bacterium GWF2_33_16]
MKRYQLFIRRLFIHLAFWIVFSLIIPLGYSAIQNSLAFYWTNYLVTLFAYPTLLIGNYFIIYFLVPKFLLVKNKLHWFIFFYIITILFVVFTEPITRYLGFTLILQRDYEFYNIISTGYLLTIAYSRQIHILTFGALKYLKGYVLGHFEKEKMKQSMLETELNMLKSQIHPHFLFNTLNNIYSLILENKNNLAAESVEKVSEILRFVLYKSSSTFILLKEEISIINTYIDLERLRYKNIEIIKEFPEDYGNIRILPLILFTFIENAFKHGTSKTLKKKQIRMKLSFEENYLIFNVENSKSPNIQSNMDNYENGIGLKNAIKRLKLYYGEKGYLLIINDEPDVFKTTLKINLELL